MALNLDHAPAVFAYASDSDISRLVCWPRHEALETTRRYNALSMVGYVEGGHYEWGVVRRSDQAFLGTCGFGDIDARRGVGEIRYVLARQYWAHGYATEAASAVLRFGFVQLGLRAVEAHAFPGNDASFRVTTKLGLGHLHTLPFDATRTTRRVLFLCGRSNIGNGLETSMSYQVTARQRAGTRSVCDSRGCVTRHRCPRGLSSRIGSPRCSEHKGSCPFGMPCVERGNKD